MIRRALLACGLLSAACSSEERRSFSPEFPADVDLAAILTFDASGELSAATGLVRFREKPFFELAEIPEDRVSTIAAVGWSSSTLMSQLVFPRADLLETTPLVRAVGCDQKLPEPVTAFVLDGDLPEGPGPLYVDWLDTNCPNLQGELSADVPCLIDRCPAAVEQTGCRLSVKLDACDFGKHDYRVDYRGQLCLESDADICHEVAATPPSLARLECLSPATCNIDLYRRPKEPLFSVQVQEILSVPARYPGSFLLFGVRTSYPTSGYIPDFVVLDEEVIVSSHDGRYYEFQPCDNPAPNLLHIFARADLAPIKTATAPPCLRSMVPSISGDQFFGIFGSRTDQNIGKFDREGRLLESRAIDLPDPQTRYYDPVQARRSRRTNEILVLFSWSDRQGVEVGSVFSSIDLETFAHRVLYDAPFSKATSFDEDATQQIAIPNDDADNLVYLNLGDATPPIHIDIPHLSSISVGQAEFHLPSSMLLLLIPTEEASIHLLDAEPRYRGRSLFYEHAFAPLIAATWPTDQSMVIVGGTDNEIADQPQAVLALFDPVRAHYLPGARHVGFGVPSRIVVTEEAAFLTLPWEAKLLRVSTP